MDGRDARIDVSEARLVRAELDRLLASPTFARATRLQLLLRYLVERELKNPGEPPKEYEIGIDVFGRDADFDPQTDAIVRVQLARLRTKLRDYSLAEGRDSPLLLDLPKGTYSPVFRHRQPDAEPVPVILEAEPAPVSLPPEPVVIAEPAPPPGGKRLWDYRWWAAAALVLFSISAALAWRRTQKPDLRPSQIVPVANYPGAQDGAAFSPDAKAIAFTLRKEGSPNFDIYVKLLATGDPLRLTSDEADKYAPVWSPDGRYIAYMRNATEGHAIYLTPALGGTQQKVAQTAIQGVNHLSWSPDGRQLAFTDQVSKTGPWAIQLVSLDSGNRHPLTSPSPEDADIDPAFSPDGRSVAFVRSRKLPTVTDLYIIPTAGGVPKRITADNRMIRGVAWTPDGNELVFSSNRAGPLQLWRISANGRGTPESVAEAGFNAIHPTISSTGGYLAYSEWSENINIWRITAQGSAGWSTPVKWIASSRTQSSPEFSPDGNHIIFASDRSGFDEIWRCDKDGSNPVQLTHFAGPATGTPHWSPDGKSIVFDSRVYGQSDIFVVDSEGENLRRLTTDSFQHGVPNWSRDGKSIYFTTNRSGGWQLWKIPAAGGVAVQVTKHGAFDVVESADGKFLYYSKGRFPGIWKMPVGGGEEAAVPELSRAGQWRYWCVTPEGYYYAASAEGTYPSIEFFGFRAQRPVTIGRLQTQPDRNGLGLAVSPDAKTILYTQLDQWVRDIMMVDHFR